VQVSNLHRLYLPGVNDDNLAGTEIYVWTNGNDEAIIQWFGDHRFQFELLLYGSGLAVMQYGEAANQNTGEIGVNLGDGQHGWFISGRNNQYAIPGRTIAFGGADAWISWISLEDDAAAFELEPDADQDFVLTLDAEGLIGGTYEAIVHFLSNDPADPDVEVAVILEVEGVPNILVEWEPGFEDAVDWNVLYDDLYFGGNYVVPMTVTNVGTDLLIIESIDCDNEHFISDPAELDLEVGEETIVNFIFSAEEAGEYEGTMLIVSNDPRNQELGLRVLANATPPPIIEVEPQAIETALITGESEEHVLTVSNDGAVDLHWFTDAEILAEPGD